MAVTWPDPSGNLFCKLFEFQNPLHIVAGMATIPNYEPDYMVAGDYTQWSKSKSDYPATGWSMVYAFTRSGTAPVLVTGAASGTAHLITLATDTTSGMASGRWAWQSYVTSGSQRRTVETGYIELEANFAAVTGGVDFRTHEMIVLEALQSTLEGTASTAELSVSIRDRSVSMMNPTELRNWLGVYRGLVLHQVRKSKRNRGRKHTGGIQMKFHR